jgi:hypothetical protein
MIKEAAEDTVGEAVHKIGRRTKNRPEGDRK